MMDIWHAFIQISTDPLSFFEFFGYWGLASILFAETGLFGFFLPGDSLLLTLGLMSAGDDIDLHILIPSLIAATILGDHFSYFLGRRFSGWVKVNINRIWLEDHHLEKAQVFYDSHGGKTILFCKFIPFVRTFAPFVAATTKMDFLRFTVFDIVGATLWISIIVGGGHYFGKYTDFSIKSYFHYFVIFLVFVLFSPFLLKFFKKKA
jgi:membrane-associated protein